jgi:hypothetical protein
LLGDLKPRSQNSLMEAWWRSACRAGYIGTGGKCIGRDLCFVYKVRGRGQHYDGLHIFYDEVFAITNTIDIIYFLFPPRTSEILSIACSKPSLYLRTRADLKYTYAHILDSNATYPLHKACSERTLLLRPKRT